MGREKANAESAVFAFLYILCKLVTYWLIFPCRCHPARRAHVALPSTVQCKGGLKTHQPSQNAFCSAAQCPQPHSGSCALTAHSAGHNCPRIINKHRGGLALAFLFQSCSFLCFQLLILFTLCCLLCPLTFHLSRKVTSGFCQTCQGRAEAEQEGSQALPLLPSPQSGSASSQ